MVSNLYSVKHQNEPYSTLWTWGDDVSMQVLQCSMLIMGGGGSACGAVEGLWEISVPSAQYFWESRITLKRKIYFKKKKMVNFVMYIFSQ